MPKENQKTYKIKREKWLDMLSGSDRHAITKQLHRMTWNLVAYRTINEARRFSPSPSGEGKCQQNWMLHTLLDTCFFESHASATRRLVDTSRGVVSLAQLVKDLQQNHAYFTRENMLFAEGLEEEWGNHYWKHERNSVIDALANVEQGQQKNTDKLPRRIFSKLSESLTESTSRIALHTNKFVAHSSTIESRQSKQADSDQARIQFHELWNSHQRLCSIANFISVYIFFGSNHNFLPIAQTNQFRHLDRPLVNQTEIDKLRDFWNQREEEIHSYGSWSIDKYKTELGL